MKRTGQEVIDSLFSSEMCAVRGTGVPKYTVDDVLALYALCRKVSDEAHEKALHYHDLYLTAAYELAAIEMGPQDIRTKWWKWSWARKQALKAMDTIRQMSKGVGK